MKKSVSILLLINLAIIIHHVQAQSRKTEKIQKIITRVASETLPGIAVYIHDPKSGEWIRVAGFADIENKIPIRKDHEKQPIGLWVMMASMPPLMRQVTFYKP